MLNWSNTKYKFTFGVGSLGTMAIMSELWKPFLSIWVMMVVALLPLAVFVCVRPGEMPAAFVRAAHVFAAAWYFASVVALAVALCLAPNLPAGWFVIPFFCAAGLLPAVFVLDQAIRGRYHVPDEPQDGDSGASL